MLATNARTQTTINSAGSVVSSERYKRNYLKRGCTPAMAAGVTDTFWTVRDLVEMVEG
jgi:hypothetical protein